MSIQVKLYGELKDRLQEQSYNAGTPSVAYLKEDEIETVAEILSSEMKWTLEF